MSDERTKRHLVGPSTTIEVRRKLERDGQEVCWIDQREVERVNEFTLSSLRGGLKLTRQEVSEGKAMCLGGMEEADAQAILRGVSAFSNGVRDRGVKSLNRKKDHLLEKRQDCSGHKLYQWMQKRAQECEKDR